MAKPTHEGQIGDTWYDDEGQKTWLCLGGTDWVEDLPPEHGASEIIYRQQSST